MFIFCNKKVCHGDTLLNNYMLDLIMNRLIVVPNKQGIHMLSTIGSKIGKRKNAPIIMLTNTVQKIVFIIFLLLRKNSFFIFFSSDMYSKKLSGLHTHSNGKMLPIRINNGANVYAK